MERCLGAGGFPSGAATLRLALVRAVATAATADTRSRIRRSICGRLFILREWIQRLNFIGKPLEHYY